MKKVLSVPAGQDVWVIERNEEGEICELSAYMYLASVGGAVICTPRINTIEDLNELMAYHIRDTAENYFASLPVFPLNDCFETKEEAEETYRILASED